MSDLWPTLEPQTFNSFAINTAYATALGAYIANRTDAATMGHGALVGGLSYIIVAGSIVRAQVDQNPLSPSILLKPIPLNDRVEHVIDGSIRDALNQPGPSLEIRRIPVKSEGDNAFDPSRRHPLAKRD